MKPKMSVRLRLLSVILPVAALSIVLTALVVQQITSDQLRDQVSADHAQVAIINETLNQEAVTAGSWDDAIPVALELAAEFDTRIVLIDIEGETLLDTAHILEGESRPLPTQSAGYIDPSLAAFDIDLPPEFEATILAEEDYERCLAEHGIDEKDPNWQRLNQEGLGDSLFDLEPLGDGDFTKAEEQALEVMYMCWAESFENQFEVFEFDDTDSFGAFNLEPALLFLGEPGPPRDVLDTSVDYRMVLAVLAIGSIAVAATYVVSRRILAPISILTKAAQEVASGGRPEPVPVTGDSELFDLAIAFNSMGTTLREEKASRRRLTTDIAHELRSPLQNIRGTLEAAQDGIRKVDLTLIDSVHEEAIFLQHLVNDLQILALADAARLHMQSEPVNVDELIIGALRGQSALASEVGIGLRRVGMATGVSVNGDVVRLRQVLSNLLDNALRHTPLGGHVELEARTVLAVGPSAANPLIADSTANPSTSDPLIVTPTISGEGVAADAAVVSDHTAGSGLVQIFVRDTGEGIPADFLPQAFDRFSRADPSRTRGTGGSGVGLAICQKLVEAHHGTISVSSVVGQGTTFVVELPTI